MRQANRPAMTTPNTTDTHSPAAAFATSTTTKNTNPARSTPRRSVIGGFG